MTRWPRRAELLLGLLDRLQGWVTYWAAWPINRVTLHYERKYGRRWDVP